MNLNMSMIRSYLARYDTESNIQDDERSIHGMRFLSSGRGQSSREYVYIGQAGDYLKDPEYADALILANGKNHILCRGSDYEELLNDVLSAFDYFNALDEKLMKAAATGRPLAEMLERLGEVLRKPLLVFGIDGTLLAGCRLNELANAKLRKSIKQQGSLGAELIGGYFTDKTGVVQHDLSDFAQATYDPDGEIAISRYLNHNDERIGFIMCFPHDESLIELAVSIEEAFAPYLAQAAEFTGALSPYQSQHLALADLVNGKPIAEKTRERLIETVGYDKNYYLICVKSLAVRNRTQRLLLATEVEKSPAMCLSCEIEDAVAFLSSEGAVEELVSQIARRFDVKSAAIGISMPMADVAQTPTAWRQALFSCDSSTEPGVRYCRDLALPFLMRTLMNEPTTPDLLHPALSTLAAYDADTHSDLLATIVSYVASGCSQAECSRQLHIHLNTLKYRLKRICELTGIDFKDQDELFYLRLSVALLPDDATQAAREPRLQAER